MLFNLTMHYMDCCGLGDEIGARVALDKIYDVCRAKGVNMRDYLASARVLRDTRERMALKIKQAA